MHIVVLGLGLQTESSYKNSWLVKSKCRAMSISNLRLTEKYIPIHSAESAQHNIHSTLHMCKSGLINVPEDWEVSLQGVKRGL